MSVLLSQEGQLRGGPREIHDQPRGDRQAARHSVGGMVYITNLGEAAGVDQWFGHEINTWIMNSLLRIDQDRYVFLIKGDWPPPSQVPEGSFGSGIHAQTFRWEGNEDFENGGLYKAWPTQGDGNLTDIYPPPWGSVEFQPPAPGSGHWYWSGSEEFKAAVSDSGRVLLVSLCYRTRSRTAEGFGTGGDHDMLLVAGQAGDDFVVTGYAARSWTNAFNQGLGGCAAFCLPRAVIWLTGDTFVWVSNEAPVVGEVPEPGDLQGLDAFHYVDASASVVTATDPWGLGIFGANGTEWYRVDATRIIGATRNQDLLVPFGADYQVWTGAVVVSAPGSGFSRGDETRLRTWDIDGAAAGGMVPEVYLFRTTEFPYEDCTEFWFAVHGLDTVAFQYVQLRVGRIRVSGTTVEVLATYDFADDVHWLSYDPVWRALEDEMVIYTQAPGDSLGTFYRCFFDGNSIEVENIGNAISEEFGIPTSVWDWGEPRSAVENDGYFISSLGGGNLVALMTMNARGVSQHREGHGELYRRES